MSRLLISRNPCLERLVEEGYELEFRPGYLLVHAVPYVTAERQVAYGTLVSELSMDSPYTVGRPSTHQVHFIGDHPHYADGRLLTPVQHSSGDFQLGDGLHAHHHFSHKRKDARGRWIDYEDYYVKIKTYVRAISDQAKIIDEHATAKTFKVARWSDDTTPFLYSDTASPRAGILAVNERAAHLKVAIVGLGGTGGYVLDFLAPTYVAEIHLFDGDYLHQHNAFRAPGAIAADTLNRRLRKVEWFSEHYGHFRQGVIPHAEMIHEGNVDCLAAFDYVFICIDSGSARSLIIDRLRESSAVIIDCGMGMQVTPHEQTLWGTLRVTTSTPATRGEAARLMPLADREDDLYRSNIQVIELNAMNAAMAVARWKRIVGMFADDRQEVESTYSTVLSQLSNKVSAE